MQMKNQTKQAAKAFCSSRVCFTKDVLSFVFKKLNGKDYREVKKSLPLTAYVSLSSKQEYF